MTKDAIIAKIRELFKMGVILNGFGDSVYGDNTLILDGKEFHLRGRIRKTDEGWVGCYGIYGDDGYSWTGDFSV